MHIYHWSFPKQFATDMPNSLHEIGVASVNHHMIYPEVPPINSPTLGQAN